MDYFGILTKAVKNLWEHKIIFAFLLFFICIPAILSLLVMGVVVFSVDMSQPERLFSVFNGPLDTKNLPILLGFAGGYFLLMVLSFFCAVIGMIGVFKGAALAEQGTEQVDFTTLWQAGLKYFWRVAAVFLAIGASAVILLFPTLLLGPLFVLMFCLLIPLMLFGRTAVEMLLAAIVNDDLGLPAALGRLWQIAQSHFWPLVLMTVLLLAIDIIAYMIVALPMNIIQQVAMQFLIMNPIRQETLPAMSGGVFRWMFVIQLVVIPVMLALQSLVYSFHLSAMSLMYLAITPKAAPSELPAEVA